MDLNAGREVVQSGGTLRMALFISNLGIFPQRCVDSHITNPLDFNFRLFLAREVMVTTREGYNCRKDLIFIER